MVIHGPREKIFTQGSHGFLFTGNVLTFELGSLGTGNAPNFNTFFKKVREKSLFLQIDEWVSDCQIL